MDAQDNPAKNVADTAGDKNTKRWRLILLVLCAVGAVLIIAILALQMTEYRFYKASPNVWPQSGAGAVSAPTTLPTPSVPATVPAVASTNSTELTSTPALTNAPEVAKP